MDGGQHSRLSPQRWARFSIGRQILMIANEMNRSRHLLDRPDHAMIQRGYERVLQLADLTIGCSRKRALRRELLRWRDLAALLYLQESPSREDHDRAMRALLSLSAEAYPQVALLLG